MAARRENVLSQERRVAQASGAGANGQGAELQIKLRIQRFDPEVGEKTLVAYEVEAPEWATLLDVLDIVKDTVDGSLSYRKSCRMMICGSCGMRMDGRAILACRERMKPIVDAGHVPTVSSMGNMPIIKGPRRRYGPVLAEDPPDEAVARPGFP